MARQRRPSVIVIGGGIAGLSAAQELAERGFPVTVFEKNRIPGGKARSTELPGSGVGGRKNLPGEHGFRFFPGFYRHIVDTMKRIPYGQGCVADNLVDTSRTELLRYGQKPLVMPTRFPHSLRDVRALWQSLSDMYLHPTTGVPSHEAQFFAQRCWQIMTSCKERRQNEYEQLGWWEFVKADQKSEPYRRLFAIGLTRSLVAAKANTASTKTIGDIGVQFVKAQMDPFRSSDRLLNGPTNEVWIGPWLQYLRSKGVDYRLGAQVVDVSCDTHKVLDVRVDEGGRREKHSADYYIAAWPVEVMAQHLEREQRRRRRHAQPGTTLLELDPTFESIIELSTHVAWMNGVQFYLEQDIPICRGHQLYVDSEWALTSISQHQFWDPQRFDLSQYGDGSIKGILSVDVSEWHEPGCHSPEAANCTRDQIKKQIWLQLRKSLAVGQSRPFPASPPAQWNLDPDIILFHDAQAATGLRNRPAHNNEPLLVNEANTWHLRPQAYSNIPNLFLAGDYLQTNTDLATMEGANEAARRAVNGIIDASGADVRSCDVWEFEEFRLLEPWKRTDLERFRKGLPWDGHLDLL